MRFFFIINLLFASCYSLFAQSSYTLDQVIGVVGNKPILQSEMAFKKEQAKVQSIDINNKNCELIQEIAHEKLLLYWAIQDSLNISEEQITQELDKKIRYFAAQLGSKEAVEEQFGKPIEAIKAEFRPRIREQLLIQQMQSKITEKANVTPAEVKTFFASLKDSVPLIPSEIEISKIIKKPVITKVEKEIIKDKLVAIKERVKNGESFGTLAFLYSEDKGSAERNGELGFLDRGMLVPEFEAAAFALPAADALSDIIETEYGFHLIQLIERRGESINARHILLAPKPSPESLQKAKNELDSLYLLLQSGKAQFKDLAENCSDDKDTKQNGGIMSNPLSGSTKFEMQQIEDPIIASKITTMEVGEVSKPFPQKTGDATVAYQLLLLRSRTQPHKANLKEDYSRIQMVAENMKRQELLQKWIIKYTKKTYIRLNAPFESCLKF